MSRVKITYRKYTAGPKEGQSIIGVESPYSADFVAGARKLNGTYDRSRNLWLFSPLVIDKIYDLCMAVYGEDGKTKQEFVILRVTTPTMWYAEKKSIEIGGRTLARAWGRDSGAKLGDDVIITTGSIRSGGSVKNWDTRAAAGTTFEVLNVPRAHAERIVANGFSDLVLEIVEIAAKPVIPEPVDPDAPPVYMPISKPPPDPDVVAANLDTDLAIAKRRAARLAKIRKELAKLGAESND